MQITRVLSLITLVLLALVAVGVRPVAAHGYIVRAIPEDNAVLERAPARVQYWFSEALEPDFSTLSIMTAAGETVASGGVPEENPSLLEARLPTTLPDGSYINELRIAFASDGHVITERYLFSVGAANAAGAGLNAGGVVPLEVVWRVLVLSSMTLLLGVTTLYSFILQPAWGSAAHVGGLPRRIMRRLYTIAGAALGLALAGNLLALFQQTSAFFGTNDPVRILANGLWNVVRLETRFGIVWNWRMVILSGVVALLFAAWRWQDRFPAFVRSFWVAAAWASALALATLSLSAHAAGSNLLPWAAILNDWLHLCVVGLWAGGVCALALVLPAALQPLERSARPRAILAALRRFTPLAAACLLITIASGSYSASLWLNRPADIATDYGAALILKLILIAPLLMLGAIHHLLANRDRFPVLAARVAGWANAAHTLRLELVAVVLVLASVGLLSATPVPKPDLAAASPTPSGAQTVGDRQNALQITTTITPGGPGVNAYDVAVTRGGLPYDDAVVRLRMLDPALDRRSDWLAPESVGNGLHIAAGGEIDRAGRWLTLVDVFTRAGEPLGRAVYEWDIRAEAAVVQARNPTAVHLLLQLGVIAAVLLALRPAAMQTAKALDWSPVTVTVAGGAVVAGVVILLIGLRLTDESVQAYDAAVNPPPQVVNAVLPTAESVARGRTSLASACPGWLDSPDLSELVRRLPRTRDEALYAAVTGGFRTLPACTLTSDDARWDVVNYLRSLEVELL